MRVVLDNDRPEILRALSRVLVGSGWSRTSGLTLVRSKRADQNSFDDQLHLPTVDLRGRMHGATA